MAGGASLATRGRYTVREAPPPLIKLPPRPKLHARTHVARLRVRPRAPLQGPRRLEAHRAGGRGQGAHTHVRAMSVEDGL
ncbi:hypothetical protein AcV7_007708 [Taiwanofungus camphoratus]|nr:hypothetical protein AcV7_007708 [Antrodia cinnamomea]